MTGWGQAGPLAGRAGHDINYIAVAGEDCTVSSYAPRSGAGVLVLAAAARSGELGLLQLSLVGFTTNLHGTRGDRVGSATTEGALAGRHH